MIIPTMSRLHRDGRHALPRRGVRFGRVAGSPFRWRGRLSSSGVLLHTRGRRAGRGGRGARRGAMCWAATSILSRPLSVRIGAMPRPRGRSSSGASSCCCLLHEAFRRAVGAAHGPFLDRPGVRVIFPTVIAYILWMEGIRAIGSGPTTSFMFLAPVFALLIAAALLGERPRRCRGGRRADAARRGTGEPSREGGAAYRRGSPASRDQPVDPFDGGLLPQRSVGDPQPASPRHAERLPGITATLCSRTSRSDRATALIRQPPSRTGRTLPSRGDFHQVRNGRDPGQDLFPHRREGREARRAIPPSLAHRPQSHEL